MNEFDFLIIIIFLVFMFLGFRKGLLKKIVWLVKFIISIFLTFIIYPYVSEFMIGTEFYQNLVVRFGNKHDFSTMNEEQISAIINNLPDNIQMALTTNNNDMVYDALNISTSTEYFINFFAVCMVNFFVITIIYLLVRMVLGVLFRTLELLTKAFRVDKVNKIGGTLLGMVQGFVVVKYLFLFLNIFVFPTNTELYNILQSSNVALFVYNINIF